ncbi:MAG: tRNA lysidine(34) synthetase TilS [Syntrophobacteraceae bacterium]
MIVSPGPGKSVHFPGGIEVVQEHAKLIIRRIQSHAPAVEPVSIEGPGIYQFGDLTLEIRVLDVGNTSSAPMRAADFVIMDDAKVKWPLELRTWKPGDRFCPLGMKGTKKLQDFFVDSRVPKEERQRTALLCDSEKICWVAGLRMDDRVKVTAETTSIVQARLIN